MKYLVVFVVLFLSGCWPFPEQPIQVWYEYEAPTSKCAKLTEYSNRIEIEPISCHKVPQGHHIRFDTVNRFGEEEE